MGDLERAMKPSRQQQRACPYSLRSFSGWRGGRLLYIYNNPACIRCAVFIYKLTLCRLLLFFHVMMMCWDFIGCGWVVPFVVVVSNGLIVLFAEDENVFNEGYVTIVEYYCVSHTYLPIKRLSMIMVEMEKLFS